jgi:DNA-binding response OmpR family regulator
MTKILVIDDSRMMRNHLRKLLESEGFEVDDWAPISALELAEQFQTSQPHLVLSDYQMPGCSGATVLRTIRRTNPETPVGIPTATRDTDMIDDLLKRGANRVLHKPISGKDLVASLNALLDPSCE